MKAPKKLTILCFIVVLVVAGMAASKPPKPLYKNLKVLPRNTTHEEMEKIMNEFKVALGVKCNHCHAAQKDNPRRMDFASDEKPEKQVAREMMKMTARINKKYFHYKEAENTTPPVSCITCHNGKAHPGPGKDEPRQENK
jgi:predicted metal-binding protein